MNELYSSRRRLTGIPEINPTEGYIPPNVSGQTSSETENVSKPDNTINTLLKLIAAAKSLKGEPKTDIGQNALLKSPVTKPSPSTENLQVPTAEPEVIPISPETTP